jgi:hypothetical protein
MKKISLPENIENIDEGPHGFVQQFFTGSRVRLESPLVIWETHRRYPFSVAGMPATVRNCYFNDVARYFPLPKTLSDLSVIVANVPVTRSTQKKWTKEAGVPLNEPILGLCKIRYITPREVRLFAQQPRPEHVPIGIWVFSKILPGKITFK